MAASSITKESFIKPALLASMMPFFDKLRELDFSATLNFPENAAEVGIGAAARTGAKARLFLRERKFCADWASFSSSPAC